MYVFEHIFFQQLNHFFYRYLCLRADQIFNKKVKCSFTLHTYTSTSYLQKWRHQKQLLHIQGHAILYTRTHTLSAFLPFCISLPCVLLPTPDVRAERTQSRSPESESEPPPVYVCIARDVALCFTTDQPEVFFWLVLKLESSDLHASKIFILSIG